MIISDGINHGKLQSIIVGELKKAGLKHRLKKIILKSVKDHKAVFGAPLLKVPSCSVICCGSTLSIPMVVTEMATVLRANAQVEGLFRKAGSQNRQKDIKRLLDAGGCVSEGHHPIDIASVLKLFLRCLPEPLISTEVQDLLLRCRLTAGHDALKPILHTLLLLPVLHVHLLHYIMELLNYIASRHKDNLMDSSNLAIVMAPSIMPLPAASSAQRLEHHVALVKIFIENSKKIGLLTEDLMSQLDDNSDLQQARRKKRRSGSLNRMLSGLRKMVSGSVHTPATVRESGKTPILNKSASKRKLNNYEALSAKMKKDITNNLPQKELSFTPMKMGLSERKRLRLSMMEARSTPIINLDFSSHKHSETSASSEDMLTSSEHLFSTHDTIDLSPNNKQESKDYVKISKQEYEEIKNRVSAIENRLSREFTDVIPPVKSVQQVQNAYEQTLEDVAMLHCPTSDQLARRLSKELKIRPNEQAKIIRSPSARKIGSIRRRSKENIPKIVRHKSWNVSTLSQANHKSDRFYPYVGLPRRERTSAAKPDLIPQTSIINDWDGSASENSLNVSDNSHKYHLRRRISLTSDHNVSRSNNKPKTRRSLNITSNNSWESTSLENSANDVMYSSNKLNNCQRIENSSTRFNIRQVSPLQRKQKWRSAAAFFMDKTGEVDNSNQTGRPSVNKLRRQNAGAVLAKAKMFETSSDKSSELSDIARTGFARLPRVNSQCQSRNQKMIAHVKPKIVTTKQYEDKLSERNNRNGIDFSANVATHHPVCGTNIKNDRENTVSPPSIAHSQTTPSLKKPLFTQRAVRTSGIPNNKKGNTPMKAVHISPRRRSPRQKTLRN